MRLIYSVAPALICSLLCSACSSGPKLVKITGTVTVNGSPLKAAPRSMVQITLVPVVEAGEGPPKYTYAAQFDAPTSTFTVLGRTGEGIPVGKYRFTIEQFMPNPSPEVQQMNQQFSRSHSQLEFEANSEDPIVVDLGSATVK